MRYYGEENENVLRELNTNAAELSNQEAAKGKSLVRRFFEQMKDPMIIILIVAAIVSGVLTVLLFVLSWEYPAASLLRSVFIIYEMICLFIWLYGKKIDSAERLPETKQRKTSAAIPSPSLKELEPIRSKAADRILSRSIRKPERATLLVAATDIYGLADGGESYFLFNLLCCMDVAAMCASVAEQIKALRRPAGEKHFHIPGRAVVLFLVLGALLPFLYQPAVSDATVEAVENTGFYSDTDSGERVQILMDNEEALEERIRLISQAKEEIIFSTFEMSSDNSGRIVMSALMEAADRGVSVYLLMDGFSYLHSLWGNPYFLALAQTEHVEVKIYNPIYLWKPWTAMGRLHDKYLIVDDLGYILGGRNTFDYFLGDWGGHQNYDWDVLVYSADAQGDTSLEQVRDYFFSIWNMDICHSAGNSSYWTDNPSVVAADEVLAGVYLTLEEEYAQWMEPMDYEAATVAASHIELVSNPTGILSKEPVVFYTITELMMEAKESVDFHTPYIICNSWMLNRLENICDAVNDVTMMTNSIANNGNPFGAADYLLNKEKILATGVQVLEYDGGISYHGKCFVIDDRLCAIGSFNWDMRSTYIDTELMLVIDSEELNAILREEMESYEESALTVIDTDTSIAPDGMQAQEVSSGKMALLRIVNLFYWIRFLM